MAAATLVQIVDRKEGETIQEQWRGVAGGVSLFGMPVIDDSVRTLQTYTSMETRPFCCRCCQHNCSSRARKFFVLAPPPKVHAGIDTEIY